MSLVWSYGFEAGSCVDMIAAGTGEYWSSGAAYVVWDTTHHSHATLPTGGRSWKAQNYFAWAIHNQTPIATAGDDYLVSLAYRQVDTGRVNLVILNTTAAGSGSAAGMWAIIHTGGGTIALIHHDGTTWQLAASSTSVLPLSTWVTITLRATKSGTTYTGTAFVDGIQWASGSVTHSTTPVQFDGVYATANQAVSGSHDTWFDDIRVYSDVVADLDAATAEGFVCGRMVDADSVDGAFTPNTGTHLFEALEAGASADWAKYAETTTDPDTMRLSTDNAGGTGGIIEGVLVNCIADTDATIPNVLVGMAESSVATPVFGPSKDCQAKTTISSAILTSDGSTAWTYAAFDAGNVVVKVTS